MENEGGFMRTLKNALIVQKYMGGRKWIVYDCLYDCLRLIENTDPRAWNDDRYIKLEE
jgi:hypothetical protein